VWVHYTLKFPTTPHTEHKYHLRPFYGTHLIAITPTHTHTHTHTLPSYMISKYHNMIKNSLKHVFSLLTVFRYSRPPSRWTPNPMDSSPSISCLKKRLHSVQLVRIDDNYNSYYDVQYNMARYAIVLWVMTYLAIGKNIFCADEFVLI